MSRREGRTRGAGPSCCDPARRACRPSRPRLRSPANRWCRGWSPRRSVTVNGTTVADYAYDANGNRLKEREDLGGPAIAAYDDQDRLLSYAGTTYTYNEAGDLETKTDGTGTTTYAYDALGNLRGVEFPDGKKIEYVIDGQNRRVGKKVC